MRASSSTRLSGFTLIEVLAALVIISLGMLGVIEAIGQTASSGARLRDRTIAHWIGMNRLTAVRLELRAPKIDKTSDEVEMAGRRWRWTMEVTETPVKSMLRIDIRVASAEAGEDASLASVTGFYGSAIAATAAGNSVWRAIPAQETPPGTEKPGDEQPGGEQPGDEQPGGEDTGVQNPDPPPQDPRELVDPPTTENPEPEQ